MQTDITPADLALAHDAEFHLYGAETALIAAIRALEQSPDFDPDQTRRAALTQAMEAIRGAA